jgi:triosephosphate isomerase (TIM)
VFLAELRPFATGKRTRLAAQDTFYERLGARTGEISPSMLKNMGVKYVIIGHSERRALGETDEVVQKKVAATLREELIAIVCVGEEKRDTHGNYLTHVEKQLRAALKGVPKAKLQNIVIAYEPVWAIGTGNNATPEDAHEMKLFIQKILSDLYGRNALAKIRILYGGSVTKGNAEELLNKGAVDGFLVGGASLRASEFATIAKIASSRSS